MKTVAITLDAGLLREVDRVAAILGGSRSDVVREALKLSLERLRRSELERRHREGYERHPVRPGELDGWESEQVWESG